MEEGPGDSLSRETGVQLCLVPALLTGRHRMSTRRRCVAPGHIHRTAGAGADAGQGCACHVLPASVPQAHLHLPMSGSPSSHPPAVCIPALNFSQGCSPLLGEPPGLPGPWATTPTPGTSWEHGGRQPCPRAAWPHGPRPAVAPEGGSPGMWRQQLQGILGP